MLGPRRAVEEVPRAQRPLLPLDDQQALAAEHEEVLLAVLGVVHGHRLARGKPVEVDAHLGKVRVLSALVRAITAELVVQPARVACVEDEPALTLRHAALDRCFRNHCRSLNSAA